MEPPQRHTGKFSQFHPHAFVQVRPGALDEGEASPQAQSGPEDHTAQSRVVEKGHGAEKERRHGGESRR